MSKCGPEELAERSLQVFVSMISVEGKNKVRQLPLQCDSCGGAGWTVPCQACTFAAVSEQFSATVLLRIVQRRSEDKNVEI